MQKLPHSAQTLPDSPWVQFSRTMGLKVNIVFREDTYGAGAKTRLTRCGNTMQGLDVWYRENRKVDSCWLESTIILGYTRSRGRVVTFQSNSIVCWPLTLS